MAEKPRLRETLRGKTLQRVAADSVRLRPDLTRLVVPTQATKLALRTIASRIADLATEITTLDAQLRQLVAIAAPRTLALLGVGHHHAAQLSSPLEATPTGSTPKPPSPHSARPVLSRPAAARPAATDSTQPATETQTARSA